jgi:sec-independent protein translocase protein TatA
MPIGLPELAIILVVALLIFGPKKIPEIANSLGRSINEFRRGSRDLEENVRRELAPGDPVEKREETTRH